MKITKKAVSNIAFVILIGLLLYPPTKAYFIRLISFAPSIENTEDQQQLTSYNWYLKGLNTDDVDFNKQENKVVFVSFWATWCPPCIAEMPSMQKLYDDYKDKATFLFVTNEDWAKVQKFYIDKGYNLPTYNQKTQSPELFYSKTVPTTFIVDKKGKIVIKKTGAANWNSDKVRKLLDKLSVE